MGAAGLCPLCGKAAAIAGAQQEQAMNFQVKCELSVCVSVQGVEHAAEPTGSSAERCDYQPVRARL